MRNLPPVRLLLIARYLPASAPLSPNADPFVQLGRRRSDSEFAGTKGDTQMLFHATTGQGGDFVADAFAAIDFELALDLADTGETAFEEVVAQACRLTGGRTLFVMPPAPDHLGITQIAAVRIGGADPAPLIFVVEEEGRNRCIRLARREEAGERFFGFARSYARLMERLTPNVRSTADA